MAKYITEQTMRRIQIVNADSGHLLARRRWIQLACNLSIAYYFYNSMRTTGENLNKNLELDTIEDFLHLVKECFGFDFTTSITVR